MIRATVALLAVATFTGRSLTGQVATAPAALREALLNRDRATSEAVRRDALARGLAPAFDSEPLLLLEGAALVADRAAAVRLLEQRAELAALRVQWLPLAVLVSLDGTLGVTYGMTATTDVPAGDTTRLRFGKYISVWRRRDGAWYLAAHLQTELLPRDAPVSGAAPSPAPAAAQLTTGPGARFAAADRAFARMAADSGAPAAFAAFAAPTAVTFAATGDLVLGPRAIRARMTENHARTTWSWAPLFAGSSADGELGYTVGEATIANTEGELWTSLGKYLTVWRRMPDGSVRFLVDGGNARPPAPRETTR